jgi:PHS family inorganic phosphate transporter-like MFS transporter
MHPAEEETYQSFEDLRRPLIPNNNNMGTISDTNNSCDDDDDDDAGQSPEMLSHPATAAAQSLAWYQNPYQITAMISNFSTSYNVVNISMVLPILEQLETASSEDAAACASSLLAGMIVGQLFGGALGDSRLGRLGALRLVMALQIVASLASAFVGVTQTKQELSHEDIFLRLAALRFFLGIGCGGVYPLAAVLSAEQGKEEESTTAATPHPQQLNNSVRHISKDEGDSVHRVVLTFSTQGMGFIAVPIVAVILLNSTTNMNFIWRAILGLGALPGIVLLLLQCRWSWQRPQRPQLVPTDDPEHDHDHSQTSSPSNQVENAEESEPSAQNEFINEGDGVIAHTTTSEGWFQTLLHEPGLGRKVLGTAGTWFLFDVVFYGNTIFQP